MLRVVAHTSAGAAQKYYSEGLKHEDYYTEKQEIAGKWFGKGAEKLGVSGAVEREQFAALTENRHPVTGEKLTPRTKEGRRVGYDLNFHAPKSLSVLYALTQDKAILDAFRHSVAETMAELEQFAETRVRKGRSEVNRPTGNLAWAEFIHFTSRPVGGIPDPHLHIHCFTFNATFDDAENRWKAAQFGEIKRNAHYFEAAFHSRLTEALAKQGYAIERKRGAWEIKGIPSSVIAKFSRRTAQIERLAEEKGITDAKGKDALGASSREGKRHGMTFPELLAAWSVRLTDEEKVQIFKTYYDKGIPAGPKISAAEAMDHALAKLFERQSVVERGHILAEALKYGVGHVSPKQIKAEFQGRGLIGRKIGDQHLVTSVDVLAEEIGLINFARSGRNTSARLGGRGKIQLAPMLSEEQQAAARHILTSRDQVIALRGGAGVGKTTLMKEVVGAIEGQGKRVYAFAPSAVASRETLREAGFAGADTVAHLLQNTRLQRELRGQVIWVDEAGLLGVRDLWKIMEIAGSSTRVILTGDTAQHAPVARGDAFRLLQQHAGLRVAEVTQIRRQELEDYRKAIESISKGDLRTGFRRLEALGAFIEIQDDAERYRALAADYLALGRGGNFPLVVSPTHAEGARVTESIREAKRQAGQLGPERQFIQYADVKWTEADRGQAENYRAGQLVQFHQNSKGITRGEIFRVMGHSEDGTVVIQNGRGRTQALPIKETSKFLVYEQREIGIGKGEQIRITRNGQSENGKRLNNGNVFTVQKFGKKGEIILTNGAVLNPNHGHFTHGYCQTSHSSQSKSVRDVLVAQSQTSFSAASREQFYVSCSRGKQTIRIYTDSREGLQESVGNTSTRMSALELAEFTTKDISSLMSTELNGKQWRDAVASRRGSDGTKSFAQQLVDQRKGQEVARPGSGISWKGYIEMRRKLAGPDGKARSKGQPGAQTKLKPHGTRLPQSTPIQGKPKSAPNAEKTVPANTPKVEHAKAKPAENKPAKSRMATRKEQMVKSYEGAAKHFQKVAHKVTGKSKHNEAKKSPQKQASQKPQVKQAAEPAKQATPQPKDKAGNASIKPLPQSNMSEAADHAQRQKAADTSKVMAQQAKVKAAAKTKVKAEAKAVTQPQPKK